MNVTVNELQALCVDQIAKGNGYKTIMIPDSNPDSETGYQELFYPFMTLESLMEKVFNRKDVVILG